MAEKRVARTATEALMMPWKEGFFRAWQSLPKLVAHLAKRDHHFSGPELGMGLTRAKHLTRRGRRGSYEYIQKHPFIAETAVRRKKVRT